MFYEDVLQVCGAEVEGYFGRGVFQKRGRGTEARHQGGYCSYVPILSYPWGRSDGTSPFLLRLIPILSCHEGFLGPSPDFFVLSVSRRRHSHPDLFALYVICAASWFKPGVTPISPVETANMRQRRLRINREMTWGKALRR